MAPYAIRRAAPRDIPAISRLLVEIDMVHHRRRPDLFRGPAAKYNEAEIAALIGDDAAPVFVCADETDTVLGYAFCRIRQIVSDPIMTDVKTLYLDDLCVEESCRGQGVGTALFAFVKTFAKSEGCYNLTLNVWACNPDAERFYRKCGLMPQKTTMETVL